MTKHLVRIFLESGVFIDVIIDAMDESTVGDVLENASERKSFVDDNTLHKNSYVRIEYLKSIAGEPTKWIGDDESEDE